MLNKNHLTFNTCDDIQKHIAPLKKYGITVLDYVRVYAQTRHRVHLGSNLNWLLYFYDHHYDSATLFFEEQFSNSFLFWHSFINLWNRHPNQECTIKIKELYGISNGITLAFSNPQYNEYFYLATDLDNYAIYEQYHNNMENLKTACFALKANLANIIKIAQNKKIGPPRQIEFNNPADISRTSNCLESELKRYYIGDVYITEHEKDVVRWLAQGKSSNEIAVLLNISKRTVEAHINNVKNRLQCHKTARIIYLLAKYGII